MNGLLVIKSYVRFCSLNVIVLCLSGNCSRYIDFSFVLFLHNMSFLLLQIVKILDHLSLAANSLQTSLNSSVPYDFLCNLCIFEFFYIVFETLEG